MADHPDQLAPPPPPPPPSPSSRPPLRDETDGHVDEARATASQWQLMWWSFRKHKLAMAAAVVLLGLYLSAALCEFIAPYGLDERDIARSYAPPQPLRFVSDAGLHLRPFVYGFVSHRDEETLQRVHEIDRSRRYPVRLFVRGEPYHLFGLIPTDRHLFGVEQPGTIHLLGTDALGQDLFSRILYGSRISLSIGLLGVAMSFVLGLAIGAASGFFGGWIDHLIQRMIEIIQSFPTIPLWMALAAALPQHWSPLQVYLGITVVLSLVGWTGLAREVRGKLLSLRQEDFVTAAILTGAPYRRVITRHLLPLFTSHIVVVLTLAIPGMILGETALSFLGLGLQPPVTSWGVLLQECQNIQALAMNPWLLTPVCFVIITVLAFNFVGDGLRDAADPYS
ncbi:MAG: ABC transporter permease [Phycisphaeraceae bacterium]